MGRDADCLVRYRIVRVNFIKVNLVKADKVKADKVKTNSVRLAERGLSSMKKILIQGAMPSEIGYYLERDIMAGASAVEKNGCLFYTARDGEAEIVIELTKMGMTNAAAATMTAIYEYHPDFIINQGTAGAHVRGLKRGDIVIGNKAVNVHSIKMEKRGFGEGMSPQDWSGMHTEYIEADQELVRMFENALGAGTQTGRAVTGTLGSGDLFSREKDRILWIHDKFGNLSEDMESFAVYSVCRSCGVPCVALRIISNNELLDEDYDEDTAVELQRVIWNALCNEKEKGKKICRK